MRKDLSESKIKSPDIHRRDFLKFGLATTGLVALNGCACFWERTLSVTGHHSDILNPLSPILDAHNHIFGAKDMQFFGYFTDAVMESSGKITEPFADFLAVLLSTFGVMQCAPNYLQEMTLIGKVEAFTNKISSLQVKNNAIEMYNKIVSEHNTSLNNMISDKPDSQLNKRLTSMIQIFKNNKDIYYAITIDKEGAWIDLDNGNEAPANTMRYKNTDDANHKFILSADMTLKEIRKKITIQDIRSHNILNIIPGYGYLIFMKNFMNYRYLQAKSLTEQYPKVGYFTPAAVDFKYWLLSAPLHEPSTLDQQIEMFSKISSLFNGKILPLIEYNPRRDVNENDVAIKAATNAVTNHGFIGIKVYPPNGFMAIGNCDLRNEDFPYYSPSSDRPENRLKLGVELDAKLHCLYEWCVSNDTPILTHCNHSMGREEYKKRASPEYWGKVLEKHPTLRICLGHFGGEESVLNYFDTSKSDPKDSWGREIVKLMRGDNNVYSDLSCHEPIMSCKKEERKIYFTELGKIIMSAPIAAERLLFGSDWYMMTTNIESGRYYDNFVQGIEQYSNLSGDLKKKAIDGIMGGNALRLYGLDSHDSPAMRRVLSKHPHFATVEGSIFYPIKK